MMGRVMTAKMISNATVAAILDRVGNLLEAQHANPHRVRAYHEAAKIVRTLDRQVTHLVRAGGRGALEVLPHIGTRLAASIDEIVHTGSLRLLERLEGEVSPESMFATIPGIGEELAHRIHEDLHVETLEELEVAAHSGRLDEVPGFGEDRVRLVREFLAATLDRSSRRRARQRVMSLSDGASDDYDHHSHPQPSVETLLELDAEYRDLAERDKLHKIAPRRFNPKARGWLPVWHPERDDWSFTLLYSNSALAHKLGKTEDWVVVYYEQEGEEEQCTVVTEYHGPLEGQRVIRGRERECADYYAGLPVEGEVRDWAHDVAGKL